MSSSGGGSYWENLKKKTAEQDNKIQLLEAEKNGLSSVLLDMQKDYIKANKQIAAMELEKHNIKIKVLTELLNLLGNKDITENEMYKGINDMFEEKK